MKRFLDLFLVLLTAPIWLPVLAVVALAVRLALGRPVFFRQARAGKGGREFLLCKFRSMRAGAGTDAERLTRFGCGLRASSLDELPELFHVIRGEMSLVGPRPLPVRYLPRYTPEQARRHEVRPGLTGWAQVHGRNALTWEEKFRLDVWYVDHRSLWLDLRILAMTAWQVARGRGISAEGQATMAEFLGEDSEFRIQNSVSLPVLGIPETAGVEARGRNTDTDLPEAG
jgi:lipopolysaccharide/colanic/teichoic acid biosynthesis glycosyltransferase